MTNAERISELEPMAKDEFGGLLNLLLEAERAGAKLLAAYLDELPDASFRWKSMRAVQLDEARNCVVLIHLLLEAGLTPSMAVGDFYAKGLTVEGWSERLQFLNRGQAWVARRLAAALPRVPPGAKAALQQMYESHMVNIRSCEGLL